MTSQWSNLRAPFNNDACVNNFPLFQAQWKPGNTAHTCTDHNGNNVRWMFDFFSRLSFYWQRIRVPAYDAFRKKRLGNLISAIPKQGEVIHYVLLWRWKPVSNIFNGFYVALSLTQGAHLAMVINSNYEVLFECIVNCLLLHRFDSGIFPMFWNIWLKLENNFNQKGRNFYNCNVNWCMLCRDFLCRTMHFAIEPGFLCRTNIHAYTSSHP